jgi:hypothetical protein
MTGNSLMKIAGQRKFRRRRVPWIAEHSDEVFPERGYGARTIVALCYAGDLT